MSVSSWPAARTAASGRGPGPAGRRSAASPKGAPVGDYVDDNRYLLAVRGADNRIWTRWFDHGTGAWTGWEGIGGLVTDPPSLLMAVEGGSTGVGLASVPGFRADETGPQGR